MTKPVTLLSALCAVSASSLALGGDPTEVIAEGLVFPIGVEADPNNNIWVSEMGAPSPTDPPDTPGAERQRIDPVIDQQPGALEHRSPSPQ